jgi:hypothetical protein
MPGHETLRQDTTHKEGPRLMPVETYLRSYMALFGGLAPLEVQARLRAQQGDLFDTWNDYLAVLGLPDHRIDTTRGLQTNALLLATLERTGIALCDAAVARDLEAMPPAPLERRVVFAFETPASAAMDAAAFAPRFDVLHRTFLGYPARLAPAERAPRFLQLYTETVARHTAAGAAPTRFRSVADTGWAAVCYALVRHPEFQLY